MENMFGYKQLEWVYFTTPEMNNTFDNVLAECHIVLPDWITDDRRCKIDITECGSEYSATLWWFNRGIKIVKPSDKVTDLNKCIEVVNERIFQLAIVFL